MKSISIRNVPDQIYETLQAMAKSNHRSLQEQIKHLLEQETKLVVGSPLAKAERWRKKLKGRKGTDVVELIREDRDR